MNKKNVVITGANRGIGNSLMVAFAESGYNVWPVVRNLDDKLQRQIDDLKKESDIWIDPIVWEGLDNQDSVKKAAEKKNRLMSL